MSCRSALSHPSSCTPRACLPGSARSRERQRANWVVSFVNSLLSLRNGELQTGVDQVRIRNLVGVGSVDFFPLGGIAVEMLGDLAEVVPRLDHVGGSAARRGRGASP